MSDDQAEESNFDIVDVGARQNSNVEMEGYSLLPDIIWTPGPEMLNSQYAKVIFTNVKECYPTNEDLLCTYTIMAGIEVKESDRVAIFCVGWAHIDQVITWVLAAKHPWPNEELSVVFPASQLPAPGTNFYQFCYLSGGEVRGASIPFNFIYKHCGIKEEQQKALFLRNHALIGTSAQINTVSTGDGFLHTMEAGHPQNLAISSTEYINNYSHLRPSSDEPTRPNTAESDSSCSEVTSSEQYAPNSQNVQQRNMSSIPLESVYTDHDVPAVASTSQPRYSNEEDLINAQIQALSPELRRRFYEMERDRQVLLGTVSSMNEENTRLRAHLTYEIDKNRGMMETLRRNEVELNRSIVQQEVTQQNSKVVITELGNEIDNHKMRIDELKEMISEKDKTIAYYSQRYGSVNEHIIALGGLPLFTTFPRQPENTDGQFEQQGHVDIGASSDMQRQCVRASTRLPPFLAALRKTRNYYVTFLSDKGDIQQKVFALSYTKLSLIRKLHELKYKKEHISKVEFQCYCTLENTFGTEFDEIRRALQRLALATSQKSDIDHKAFMESDMIEEIKNRLEINRKNIYTVRAKAIDVFNDFIKTYISNVENRGAAQPQAQDQTQPLGLSQAQNTMNMSLTPAQAKDEVEHIQTLYSRLDNRLQYLLSAIDKSVKNTYVWN